MIWLLQHHNFEFKSRGESFERVIEFKKARPNICEILEKSNTLREIVLNRVETQKRINDAHTASIERNMKRANEALSLHRQV
jgi:hypothetical protein